MNTALAPTMTVDLQDAGDTAGQLHRLLAMLLPTSPSGTIIYFQPQPRTPGILQMLGQFREINRQSKNDAVIALSEFNIGLYYLSWQQFTDADAYFRKAGLFWSLLNYEAAGCLTHFALGCNQFLALNYVVAMNHLQKARRNLDKLRRMSARGHETSPPTPPAFLEALHEALRDIQHQLQTAMQAMWQAPSAPAGGRPHVDPSAGPEPTNPPGSYATGTHVESDFPAEPVINPKLQPRSHFVAPFPSHVPAGENYQWVQVTESSGNFIPNVLVGDWLYIHTAGSRHHYHLDDLLIIGSQINGSVRVEERGQQVRRSISASPLYVAKFVRNTTTGRILLLPNEQRQLVELDPVAVFGNVVGFWHEMFMQESG